MIEDIVQSCVVNSVNIREVEASTVSLLIPIHFHATNFPESQLMMPQIKQPHFYTGKKTFY